MSRLRVWRSDVKRDGGVRDKRWWEKEGEGTTEVPINHLHRRLYRSLHLPAANPG